MEKNKKKIVISGWYGPGNIGDEAILQALINELKNKYKNADITVLSFNPKYNKRIHKIKAVYQIPSSIKRWLWSIFTLNFFKTFKIIRECDIFIMGGGGFLSDWPNKNVPKQWLKQFKIVKFLDKNKKTYIYKMGVGPFIYENNKKLVKNCLNKYVDEIIVREKFSYNELKKIGINKEIKIEIDPVAVMDSKKFLKNNYVEYKTIGVIYTKYFNNDELKWKKLLNLFEYQIDIILKNGFNVKLLFFQSGIEKQLADCFKNKFGNKIEIIFLNNFVDAFNEIQRCQGIISFRLHGNIISYNLKKPFLPIIYHYKTAGFLELINFDKEVIEVGDGINWKNFSDKNIWLKNTKIFLERLSKDNF